MAALPDVGAGLVLKKFWTGAVFAASGIAFTFQHRRLLAWSLVPMAVQILLFGAFAWLAFSFTDGLAGALTPPPDAWYAFLGGLVRVAVLVLLLVASVVATLIVGGVVCDPFYDVLSEETESILVGRDVSTPFSVVGVVKGILTELGASIWRLAVYAAVAVPLWILGMTGVGSVVAVPAALAWTWMFVALTGVSRSMSRHGLPGKTRLAGVFSIPTTALGFGAIGWILSHVPLTSPFLVVGGTRLYLALAAHGRIASNLTDGDKRALRGA